MEIATRPYRSCEQPSTIWSARGSCCSGVFRRRVVWCETLLDRGTDDDLREAEAAIERLAAAPAAEGLAMRDIWVLRSRALLARAHGEGVSYLDFVNRYRDMATSLGFEGHIAWADALL